MTDLTLADDDRYSNGLTWAMLEKLQYDGKSWIKILKLNFGQLVISHKSSCFCERTQPLGPLCLWSCFWPQLGANL